MSDPGNRPMQGGFPYPTYGDRPLHMPLHSGSPPYPYGEFDPVSSDDPPYQVRGSRLRELWDAEARADQLQRDIQIEADVGEHYREERDQQRERAERAETALRQARELLDEWRTLGTVSGGGYGGTLEARTDAALADSGETT